MIQVHTGKRGKYNSAKTGLYFPLNPKKCLTPQPQLQFKSALEQRMMLYLDRNANIITWKYEPKSIRYFDKATNKVRRYYIDFEAVAQIGPCRKTIWIEVKPSSEAHAPKNTANPKAQLLWLTNSSKWAAATQLAKSKGAQFVVLTEKELN